MGNANPTNERAQARVYALWSFAKAYVEDKDRVIVDGGKGAEIRVSGFCNSSSSRRSSSSSSSRQLAVTADKRQ